ncbi:MAG: 30S ribosomal protein S1 [Elusimicrobiota bacterium]
MAEEKMSMEDVVRHVENTQQLKSRIVNGTVIEVNKDKGTVLIDAGFKSEGVIPLAEFADIEVKEGDVIEVFVVKRSFDSQPILSYRKAQQEQNMEGLEAAFRDELVLDAKLEKKVKGGLIVDISGVKAFMPASLVGYPMVKNLDTVIGTTVPCKIIDFDRREKNIVVSWRKAIEEDVRRKREELFDQLYPGKIIKGRVTGIKSFGAFIDLGGIDGLLHISELSWGHVENVEDVVKVGDEIEIKVKSFNPNSNKIALSLKETKPHPWENIEERYAVGNNVEGKVTGTTTYGAFVELESGVEGLIKVEEISWIKDVKHAGDALSNGDTVKVKILEIDQENKKIALSLKQTQPNPWDEVASNYQAGNIIEGEITHITDFGAFMMLKEGVEGLIHISDFSWNKTVKDVSEFVQVGDTVKVKILGIEQDKQKISLGLKQLEDNPFNAYPVGNSMELEIKNVQRSGAYLKLDDKLEAYLHVSNYARERVDDLREKLEAGQKIVCKIISNKPEQNLIEVSVRAMVEDDQKEELKKYSEPSKESGATLKDLLGDKLDGLTG